MQDRDPTVLWPGGAPTNPRREQVLERALREAEERLRFALDATSEGFWDWNIETGVVFFSDQWLKNLGYVSGELPSRVSTWENLIHPDDAKTAEAVLESRLSGREPIAYSENRLRHKSGEYRWFADRGRVVERGGDGRALRMVGTDADITERKNAEEARLRAEAQLTRTERMATVGVLAAGVAHEINNPLSYILNNVAYAIGALRRAPAPERWLNDVVGALLEAQEGAERVKQIIGDLRTFSRVRDDEMELIDPRDVLESSINIARKEIRQRAQLVLELGATRPVLANRARLGQIFLNLIVNALEAIEPGASNKNRIRIECRSDDTQVEVTIHDTGVGIAPAHLSKLFDPFYTTKPVGVGTGLGLSICHNLVEALGGTIHVDSELGVGTSFRVSLPHGPLSELRESDRSTPTPATGCRALKMLLIDDDPLVARSVHRAMASRHDVVVVGDGPSALKALEGGHFDLVLCDVMMPGMTGVELLAEVKRRDLAVASRFVMMTGLFAEDAKQQLALLEAPLIGKPFNVDEFNAAVAEVMVAPERTAP